MPSPCHRVTGPRGPIPDPWPTPPRGQPASTRSGGRAGPACRAQVVVEELARVVAPEQPHHRRPAPRRAGAAGRSPGHGPASARCAPARPASRPPPARRRPPPATRPASRAAVSASRVRVPRSARHRVRVPQLQQLHRPLDVGQAAAPELGVRVGSAPRGSRSFSTRALIRRISMTCSRLSPPRGYRIRVGESGRTRCPRSGSPATNRARSSACASHTLRPAGVVLLVGGEAAHQRPLPPLGPQVGVDAQRRVGRGRPSSRRSSSAIACAAALAASSATPAGGS